MSDELEDKVVAYKELSRQINELERQRKALGAEILPMLPKDAKTFYIADYRVQRYARLSIKISLEDAKMFSATKVEEVVDKAEIKRLHKLGHTLPDVQEIESLMILHSKRDKAASEELPAETH
ncbi:MAG: hypothetical protein HYX48_06725 [Chlamydiales bacterium]|nr:hypothetical protein [Chlamydiales bacterium]